MGGRDATTLTNRLDLPSICTLSPTRSQLYSLVGRVPRKPTMSWFSILPAHLTVVETWVIRFFVSLCTLINSIRSLAPTATVSRFDDWAVGSFHRLRRPPLYCSIHYIRNPIRWWKSTWQAKTSSSESGRTTQWACSYIQHWGTNREWQ